MQVRVGVPVHVSYGQVDVCVSVCGCACVWGHPWGTPYQVGTVMLLTLHICSSNA